MDAVKRILLLGLAVTLALLIPAMLQAGPEYGRSVVGVARRTDGTVVVVTAWCIGNRHEDLRISGYAEAQLGEELYRTTGPSSDPLTMVTIGQPARDFEVKTNRPLPTGPLVAYNAGARRDWLIRRTYPSSATAFLVGDLPVSDAVIPEKVMVGQLKVVPLHEMVAAKCVNPG
ncbi:hypothetical protein [Mariniluteicoccus flavus]